MTPNWTRLLAHDTMSEKEYNSTLSEKALGLK